MKPKAIYQIFRKLKDISANDQIQSSNYLLRTRISDNLSRHIKRPVHNGMYSSLYDTIFDILDRKEQVQISIKNSVLTSLKSL